jgi:hypothetical protein
VPVQASGPNSDTTSSTGGTYNGKFLAANPAVVGQQSPSAGNSGAPSTPPSGNYPGSGSSPQPGVVPPPIAPSGPTPGAGNGGVTNTPPSGVTPGSGASPNPTH